MMVNTVQRSLIGLGNAPSPETGSTPASVKSFRDVLRDMLAADGTDKTKKTNDISPEMRKKVETAINWLARYLGIKPGILLAVMDKMGINPDDMADQTKFMEIIKKIADYFKLDEDQEKEITRELGGILGFSF